MKSISKTALIASFFTLLIWTGCTQNYEIIHEQPTSQIKTGTQVFKETEATKNNIYSSVEHNFSFEYPRTWQVTNIEENIIITSDEKNIGEAPNLSLQYNFSSGDVTLGMKEIKKSEIYINPQGIKFIFGFYSPDENIYNGNDLKTNLNTVYIIINTDVIPGLKMFTYDKITDPNAEKQLMDILKTVSKVK